VAKAPDLSPLETNDREDEIGDWLDGQGISEGWDIAATFVAAGIDIDWLGNFVDSIPESAREGAVRWLNYTLETELLMNEIDDATTRISTLVSAASSIRGSTGRPSRW
jgi:hypothetical protein